MKKALLIALLLAASAAFAQTVYTEVLYSNNACFIAECSIAAKLSDGASHFTPAATLYYQTSIRQFGNQAFSGSVTFNGTAYNDFSGTFTDLGCATYCYWKLEGTFNGGQSSVLEQFKCFRSSCNAKSGQVVN